MSRFDTKTPCNFHTHTVFCDGNDTAEALVKRAIELGCEKIGFSGHSYTNFDKSYCMSRENTAKYKECIAELKEKYGKKIEILCGIEQDYYSDEPTDDYDYVIGSVHYIKKDGVYLPIDESRENQQKTVKNYYGGDFYSFAKDYFDTVSDVYNKTKCDIIGHFDLVSIYNEGGCLFDEANDGYRAAYTSALEKLVDTDAVFEYNTGAIARGKKSTAYPSKPIIDWLKSHGKKIIFSSDCHAKDNLLFGYDMFLRDCE